MPASNMQPWNLSAKGISPANLYVDSHNNLSLKAPPAFSDPPEGGYKYEPYGSDTAYPFYYSAGGLAGAFLPCAQGSVGIPVETANQLRFEDCPANHVNWPLTVTTSFTTSLVGVLSSGLASTPLFTWTWQSTFNGDAGGVSQTKSIFPIDPNSGTGGVTITSINGVPQTPPSVSCTATPNSLWPPNGKPVLVTVSGIITPGTQVIPSGGTAYAVLDEYGQVQPSGSFALGAGGQYSFGVPLIAARNGDDKDGRTYTINIVAADQIGNVGTCSAVVTVPHDQGH